jgi:HAD superfamily hydrolase (TIGR01509 family)
MFSVIFDMDGTLLDTQRILLDSWDYAGEKQNIKNIGTVHIPFVCGMNESDWSRYLENHFPHMDLALFKKDCYEYIAENMKVRYKPGAEELLQFLKMNGVKIALASGSSHKSIDHHLAVVGGEKYFDAIVGGRDVEHSKPAPDIFLLAAEKLGAYPKDCFVIEDSVNGIKAGVAAGMQCIGIPDIVPFEAETKALLIAEFSTMYDVIELFKEYL